MVAWFLAFVTESSCRASSSSQGMLKTYNTSPLPSNSSSSSLNENTTQRSALAAAQLLIPPRPSALTNGEFEDYEWWEQHLALLTAAREELGPKHPELYAFDETFIRSFLHPPLRQAVEAAYDAADAAKVAKSKGEAQNKGLIHAAEKELRSLLKPTAAENVFRFQLFNQQFCNALSEEVAHWEAARIPLRRPNGMNRYGAVLDAMGLEASLQGLVETYLRPLGQLLFPERATDEDFAEHHGFVVRYGHRSAIAGANRVGANISSGAGGRGDVDVELGEHADAATVTLNVLLSDGRKAEGVGGFVGGGLYFGGLRFSETQGAVERVQVPFENHPPGSALLHLGQQLHGAAPLVAGERVNLVIWCFGSGGYVRAAPYSHREQSNAASRWNRVENCNAVNIGRGCGSENK